MVKKTVSEFEQFVKDMLDMAESIRTNRRFNYQAVSNVFQNFLNGSEFLNIPPEKTALSYMSKQLIGFRDNIDPFLKAVERNDVDEVERLYNVLEEKAVDTINYILLILGMAHSRMEQVVDADLYTSGEGGNDDAS